MLEAHWRCLVLKKILLGFAFCVALLIGFIAVSMFLETQRREAWKASGAPEYGQVVCADLALPAGHVISEKDIAEVSMAPEQIIDGSILCSEFVVGKKTSQSILRGDRISSDNLVSGKEILAQQSKFVGERHAASQHNLCAHERGSFAGLDGNMDVIVVDDIPEGQIYKLENFENAEAKGYTVDKLPSIWQAVGRPSKYGNSKNEIIGFHDLESKGDIKVSVLTAARDIAAGAAISPDDIAIKQVKPAECPFTALCSADLLDGCTAHVDIPKGAVLRGALFDKSSEGEQAK